MHVVDKQDFVSRNEVGANIIVASFDTTGVPRTWGMLITKMLGSNCAKHTGNQLVRFGLSRWFGVLWLGGAFCPWHNTLAAPGRRGDGAR